MANFLELVKGKKTALADAAANTDVGVRPKEKNEKKEPKNEAPDKDDTPTIQKGESYNDYKKRVKAYEDAK